MTKLPVGQIIREAYAFTFQEIGTVIGLTWIPVLINTVASYFAIRISAATLDSLESGTPPPDANVLLPLPLALLSFFLIGMIGVALSRQALGLRKGTAFAHIAITGDELRVFAGFIGVNLLAILFVLILMTAVGAIAMAVGGATAPLAGAIGSAAGLVGGIALIYAVIRLGFLLVPSVIVDGHFGLTRSWQLAKGNVGRIVLILLATVIPLFLILQIAAALVMGPPPQPPANPPTDLAGVIHLWAEQSRFILAHLPALMGVSLVMAPLGYSLLFTPAALAYRILSGKAIVKAHDS